MMRKLLLAFAVSGAWAAAQTHKVSKPETVVRAVGVYEWTGDMSKPTASRLIPVTVFIDGKLEDAGVYLARPIPFALLTGNYYELQQAGIAKGGLQLAFARHVQTEDAMFDDGWFGYGSFKGLPAAKKAPVLVASRTLPELKSSRDDGKPHFSGKQPADAGGSASSGSGSTSSGTTASSGGSTDSDRPTLHRKTDSGSDSTASPSSGTTASSGTANSGTTASSGAQGSSSTGSDPDRPTLHRKAASDSDSGASGTGTSSDTTASSGASGSGTTANDPDRPTLHRKSGSDSDSGASSAGTNTGSVPEDDPDRPHFSKRPADDSSTTDTASAGESAGSTAGGTSTASGSAVPSGGSKDDPDRPTLKRRTADDIKRDRAKAGSSTVTEAGSFENDPDRPTLHYGKPTNAMNETDLPQLVGMPVDTKQIIAVSDAANREPHDFARPWEDDAERTAILTKMEVLARAKLTTYTATAAAATAAVHPAPAVKTPVPMTAAARRAAAAKKKAEAEPPPGVPLLDEELKGYTLSYGGAPTYVYTAHTAGTGAALDYVTVVAQTDAMGELKPALQNVTDAAHLDRTPRMRLVDAVDVEASNRASLIFELRGQRSRQFGVYRVIGAQADQTFVTGTTQ